MERLLLCRSVVMILFLAWGSSFAQRTPACESRNLEDLQRVALFSNHVLEDFFRKMTQGVEQDERKTFSYAYSSMPKQKVATFAPMQAVARIRKTTLLNEEMLNRIAHYHNVPEEWFLAWYDDWYFDYAVHLQKGCQRATQCEFNFGTFARGLLPGPFPEMYREIYPEGKVIKAWHSVEAYVECCCATSREAARASTARLPQGLAMPRETIRKSRLATRFNDELHTIDENSWYAKDKKKTAGKAKAKKRSQKK